MFSDHLQKVTRFSQLGLVMLAGGLVFVCQLLAMAMVADKPFQNTGVRDLQQVAPQVALADCIQHSTGPARHGCIRQSQLESEGRELAGSSPASEGSAGITDVATEDESVTSDKTQMMRVAVAR